MNSFRQLLRRPLKAVLGLLLITLAAAVFVTCMGQYLSVDQFRQEVEETYSTVACPTEEAKKVSYETPSGIQTGYGADMNPDLWELLQDQAAREGGLVQALSHTRLYTACLPEVSPLNYTDHWNAAYNYAMWMVRGIPYSSAMLAVRLTGIDPQTEPTSERTFTTGSGVEYREPTGIILHCEGVVEQVVSLQEGFPDPTGWRIELDVTVWDQEELAALGLEVGGRYLVCGRDYKDLDYELRSQVSVDQSNFEQPFSMDKLRDNGTYWVDSQGNHHPMYEYENTEGDSGKIEEPRYGVVDRDDLDMANACGLTLCDRVAFPLTYMEYDETNFPIGWKVDWERRLLYTSIQEAISPPWYEELLAVDAAQVVESYHVPTIAPLTGSVEDFLADPAHADWVRAREDAEIDHHAFPLLAVDKVGYQGDFARQQVRIVEGRDFTPQEQAEGSRICVLSQSLAAANGLSVGDRITLRSYSYDPNIYENKGTTDMFYDTLPTGAFYSHAQGFHDGGTEYTIVGLYRQDNEWHNESSAYAFLPNTVFVPSGAVSGDAYTCNHGMYLSIVLKNGSQAEFEQLLKDAGFENCFVYYDQGYSKIAGDLDVYGETVRKAAWIGAAAFAAMLGLFLLLYPGGSASAVRVMNSLGAGRGRAIGHVVVSALYLLVPGVLLGTVLGGALWEKLTAQLMRVAGAQLVIQTDVPALMVPLAAALLAVGLVLTLLTALLVTGANPMKRK